MIAASLHVAATIPPNPSLAGFRFTAQGFVYNDLARACLFLLENYGDERIINVGYGSDLTIKELAETVRRIIGFGGEIVWDTSKPDGTPRKWLDSSRLFAMGWKPEVDLECGIRLAYEDFLKRFGSR
jgi:GDP-L-fucose synthase